MATTAVSLGGNQDLYQTLTTGQQARCLKIINEESTPAFRHEAGVVPGLDR